MPNRVSKLSQPNRAVAKAGAVDNLKFLIVKPLPIIPHHHHPFPYVLVAVMFRSASRRLLRQTVRSVQPPASTRFLSTAPPHLKHRSWKNSAVRWGIAVGGIYFYNTSPIFAEEPARKSRRLEIFFDISSHPFPSGDTRTSRG